MKTYSPRYDAQYDTETMQWLEKRCNDKNCYFCKDRPETVPDNILEIDENFDYTKDFIG